MTNVRRQLLVGLLAIPLSVLPFVAYGTWTPQGRHLADEIRIRFDRPTLPDLTPREVERLRAGAPSYRGHVMPLVYHGVGSETDGEGDFAVPPERFAEHLAALRAAGMHFVTAEQVAAAFAGERELPENAVLITFDDGRSDAVLWATPLLEQARARATMFVITDQVETPGTYYAGWGEMLESDVWDLQSHTAAGHDLQETSEGEFPVLTSRADHEDRGEWVERVTADLDRADRAIRESTGRRPVAFAYPFGAWGVDRTNDPAIVWGLAAILQERYALAFHQDDQEDLVLAGPSDLPLLIRRLQVGDWTGAELLEQISAAADRTPTAGARP